MLIRRVLFILLLLLPLATSLANSSFKSRGISLASSLKQSTSGPSIVPINETNPLVITGDGPSNNGIFDPSLALDQSNQLIMTYSSVVNSAFIFTRIASVNSNGYTYLSDVNSPVVGAVVSCDGSSTCQGNIIHEVSSVAPIGNSGLIVIAHTYLYTNTTRYDLGYFSAHTAPSSSGPWTEAKLLGWNAGGSFSTSGAAQNINNIPGLSSCIILSEPSLLRYNSTTYLLATMCAVAAPGGGTMQNVVLLSAEMENSTSLGPFSFVATLLQGIDMLRLGFNISDVSAPNLFLDDENNLFIIVTPFLYLPFPFPSYFGCMTFYIDTSNPSSFHIPRDANSAPIIASYVVPNGPYFSGACTILPSSPYGRNYLLPVFVNAAKFMIYPTSFTAPVIAAASGRVNVAMFLSAILPAIVAM